jgi:predicted AlkP superfamily phosphohydrolase/phosphomutase
MTGSLLAVGLDATDLARLVAWADAGDLPVLSRALAGRRGRVASPADVGSGAVWPTFTSGRAATEHGFCSDWTWRPDEMRVTRAHPPALRPGWAAWPEAGLRGLVLDVPFAPAARAAGVAEILDWGGHDWLGDPAVIWPATLQDAVDEAGAHGFTTSSIAIDGPTDWPLLRALADEAAAGAAARGRLVRAALARHPADVALVVFPELHRAGHFLWHLDRPDHPALAGASVPAELPDAFRRVAIAVDGAVGVARAALRPPVRLVLFALHGMRAAHGVVDVLPTLLESWGFAVRRPAARRGAADWLALGARLAKQSVPAPLKRHYYRLAPRSVTTRLAQPPASEVAYDWARTQAFAWPSDQHGWIRVGLAGRERDGAVPRSDYDAVCAALATRLTALVTATGARAVERVVRVADDGGGAPPPSLPDLVVHWTADAVAPGARLAGTDAPIPVIVRRITGEHASDGWYAVEGDDPGWPDTVDAASLLASITRLATRG